MEASRRRKGASWSARDGQSQKAPGLHDWSKASLNYVEPTLASESGADLGRANRRGVCC
ncbi:unnamed protein product [Protopolystoma xenopodis]|uniref:Uncharacterized protein n=1 Tax=Protopolystoma xenopodis TaxID=117903 RepID=A0A3S5AQZ1_9PLAT|nr:unnamed protein product [Protopolystoma xenopodis]